MNSLVQHLLGDLSQESSTKELPKYQFITLWITNKETGESHEWPTYTRDGTADAIRLARLTYTNELLWDVKVKNITEADGPDNEFMRSFLL